MALPLITIQHDTLLEMKHFSNQAQNNVGFAEVSVMRLAAWAHCLESMQDMFERIKSLEDRLNEGIEYDAEDNKYYLVWTQRELDEAKAQADEIMAKLFGGNSI